MSDEKESVYGVSEAASVGFVQLPLLILFDTRLSMPQKILWAVLNRFKGSDGYCFPGVPRLATALGIKPRMIYNHLTELEEHGLIIRQKRPGRTTEYGVCEPRVVYAKGSDHLSDDALSMLVEAGEKRLVDRFLDRRRRAQEEVALDEALAESQKKSESVGDAAEEGKNCVAEKKTGKGRKIKKKIRNHEDTINRSNEKIARTENAFKKRKKANLARYDNPNRPKKLGGRRDEDGLVELGSKDIEAEWILLTKEKWPEVPTLWRSWQPKKLTIVKRLIARHGFERTMQACKNFIIKWEYYVDLFGLGGYPSIENVSRFQDQLMIELDTGKRQTKPRTRERARKEREYHGSSPATRSSDELASFE